MNHKQLTLLTLTALGATLTASQARADDEILRQYQSNRSSAMGGVRMTTGLYDDNFFSNPARITANPKSKFELLQTGVEVSNPSNISSLVKSITSDSDIVQTLGNTAGSNTHLRVQEEPMGYFLAPTDDRKWAFGIGFFSSTQVDLDLRNSFQVGAEGITDEGVAVGFGYKFLNDKLSVGITGHLAYRLGMDPNFTFVQLLQGKSLSPTSNGGQGAMVDADLGVTYELPILPESAFKFSVGAAVDNLLGGGFSNLNVNLIPSLTCTRSDGSVGPCAPPPSPRSFGFGVAVSRATWGVFENSVLAFEVTDIGNNSNSYLGGSNPTDPNQYGNGSIYRLLHLGGETHWKFIAIRAGFNQGYPSAGLGFDLRFCTIDFSTYGEELTLNAGGLQDRRYALQIGFQI